VSDVAERIGAVGIDVAPDVAPDGEAGEAGEAGGVPGGDLDGLRRIFRDMGSVVVAFSGGADSAFVAWVATDTLGTDRVLCATAVSPSLAPEELADCRLLAAEWGLRSVEVATDELADPAYSANDGSRCYHCKASLMDALAPILDAEAVRAEAAVGVAAVDVAGPVATTPTVALGVNLDDLGDHRPGQQAAAERGAVFPLVDAGFTKADVRSWSRRLGLRTWDKPAAACLASRVPYGTAVTFGTLRSVAEAESGLRALGLTQLRVRHYGDTARIEVPTGVLARVVAMRERVTAAVHAAGYRYVTLDLDGFRSGNLNDALTDAPARRPALDGGDR
jgi:uncharacterized protein